MTTMETSQDTEQKYWAVKVRTMNGIAWLFYRNSLKRRVREIVSKRSEVINYLELIEINKEQYLRGLERNQNNKLS